MLRSFSMAFDGQLLSRGFWLYVWEIIPVSSQLFYVTFEDAAEAARDHHAAGVRSMDLIRAWAGEGDDQ